MPSEPIAPHVLTEGKKPKSQIFLKFYFIIHYNNNHVCLFVCNRGDTIHYHGGLRSRELGQAPMLQVFLTPREALSSHPLKQMV